MTLHELKVELESMGFTYDQDEDGWKRDLDGAELSRETLTNWWQDKQTLEWALDLLSRYPNITVYSDGTVRGSHRA